ncbi:hypothetical protein PVAND_008034 [Polypedilum vanderplanki]|uniref:Maelstrom domain-containing protein n=1 Tax=Polypedilum vanderplanki TaxID=319348 RepID=A0A9J6C8P7_POLVA|nr:hypothetical protein PVAND_008034 [Polypedilum vanderplanki]
MMSFKRRNKNSKQNAFKLFMEDLMEKKLQKYISTQEAQLYWNQLSEYEKEEYKYKAKKLKEELGVQIAGKSLSIATPQSEFEKRLKMENDKFGEQEVKKSIEDSIDIGTIDDKVFYIISTETFYEDSRDVFPCELAIAKFSLKRGIFDSLQIRINPGPLPLGTAYTAIEKSKNKHKYPIPSNDENDEVKQSSYILILEKIITFIHPLDEIPMFFAEGHKSNDFDILYNTKRTLQKIFIEGCEYQIARELQVFSISDLFYYLNEYLVKSSKINGLTQFSCPVSAYDKFKRITQSWLYSIGNYSCVYHNEEDCSQFCCLYKVHLFCFIIAAFCCDKSKYPLIRGQHYPKNYAVET